MTDRITAKYKQDSLNVQIDSAADLDSTTIFLVSLVRKAVQDADNGIDNADEAHLRTIKSFRKAVERFEND